MLDPNDDKTLDNLISKKNMLVKELITYLINLGHKSKVELKCKIDDKVYNITIIWNIDK